MHKSTRSWRTRAETGSPAGLLSARSLFSIVSFGSVLSIGGAGSRSSADRGEPEER